MSQRLYKYKSVSDNYDENGELINRDIDNLLQEQLWVSSLENMNDPLECGFYVDKSLNLDKISDFQQILLRSYACISFSTSVICRRLWNYYTDGMRGMVIEYSDSSIRQALKKASIRSRVYEEDKDSNTSLEGHVKSGNIVEISSDGRYIVSASNDNTIQIWDLMHIIGEYTLVGHEDLISSIAISPDGRWLASASYDQSIKIWDLQSRSFLYELLDGSGSISSIAISPDGKYLASASEDYAIRVWETKTSKCVNVLEGHTRPISSMTFSPDGKILVSGSHDETIKAWDYLQGKLLYTIENHTGPILSVSIDSDGTRLASASTDSTIRIWDLRDGLEGLQLNGHTDWVNKVIFLPRNRCISASYDNTIRLWDLEAGECIHVYENPDKTIDSIASYDRGRECIYISSDGNVESIDLLDNTVTSMFNTANHEKTIK